MARVYGPESKEKQEQRSLELQSKMSSWIAAAYLKNRGWTLTETLWHLLGIRSERNLVPVVATGFLTDTGEVLVTGPRQGTIYWH